MYKERIRKILTGLLVLCMVFAMNGFASVSAAKKVAATKVKITNAYTVMAVGQSANFNCKLTPSKSTDKVTWKSSNKSIANPDANGKFTAKKSGTVTITATATSGAKASVKVLVVSKNGVTSLQTRVNKMLAAKNINKITIKNLKTEESYTIAAGDYSKKTLTINAPMSDVTNSGRFKKVVINDVKNGTYTESATGNAIVVNDKDAAVQVSEGAYIYSLDVTAENGVFNLINNGSVLVTKISNNNEVNVNGTGTLKNLKVNSDAKISVAEGSNVGKVTLAENADNVSFNVNGTVSTIIVNKPTNLVLTGSTSNVSVRFTAQAAGSTLESAVPVAVTTDAKIEVVLEKGAEASTVVTTVDPDDVKLTNNTSKKIDVVEEGTVATTPSTPSTGTTPSNGDTPNNNPTVVTKTVSGTVSGSAVAFVLPTALNNVKKVVVKANVLGQTPSYTLTSDALSFVRSALTGNDTSIAKWVNVESKTIEKNGYTVTVTGRKGETEKNVSFGNFNVKVDVQGSTSANTQVVVKRAGNQYTLTKSADNTTLFISGANLDAIASMVTFIVTY